MPKQKTHSGAKKRFKVTAGGKLLRRHAAKRATSPGRLAQKSANRKRRFRRDKHVAPSDVKAVKKQLGIG
jgi:large subunit ribosomal protein L35